MCYVDRSWDQEGRAGIGVYLTQNGMLLQWLSKLVRALNSTQAEAMAVLEGARMLKELTGGEGFILSDSMDIVNAVQSVWPNVTDWRSFSEIWPIWEIIVDLCNHKASVR